MNAYQFLTRWRVEGSCGEVADILRDALTLPAWWPSVYLRVDEIEPKKSDGTGGRVGLLTKGWLPYTLAWEFTVVESRYPYGYTISASGDFVGRGIWTFEQDGAFVSIVYDWQIRAEKPLLKQLSPLLKPIFAANHRWAMDQGEESLKLELLRRRALNQHDRARIPPPPGPVTYAAAALVGGAVVVSATLVYLILRASRRRC